MNILVLTCFFITSVFSLSLKERFDHAQVGDYIVTEQDKNVCVLFVRDLNQEVLAIDEMTFYQQDLPKNFKKWKEATFHNAYPLSWISFQFDRKTGALEEAYNFNEKTWLEFEEKDVFLKGLLNLNLNYVPEKDRKKIGPMPQEREQDLRKCWSPPLFIEGVKYNKPTYEVYKGRWDEDQSLLSKCTIDMYFPKNDPSLPFPTWMEINNGHYGFKLKGIDSGHNFPVSKLRPLPKKPMLLASGFEYKKDLLILKIKVPRSSRNFDLAAECPKTKKLIPLKYQLTHAGEKDLFFMSLSLKHLQQVLETSKSYYLIFYPDNNRDFFIRTQDLFICP
jgi:hypothetical protein